MRFPTFSCVYFCSPFFPMLQKFSLAILTFSHLKFSFFATCAAILLHKVLRFYPKWHITGFIMCVQGHDACLALVPHSRFVFVDASQIWAIIRNAHDMHLQWKDDSVFQSCFEVHRTAREPSLARKEWLIDAFAYGKLLSIRLGQIRPRRSCEDIIYMFAFLRLKKAQKNTLKILDQ